MTTAAFAAAAVRRKPAAIRRVFCCPGCALPGAQKKASLRWLSRSAGGAGPADSDDYLLAALAGAAGADAAAPEAAAAAGAAVDAAAAGFDAAADAAGAAAEAGAEAGAASSFLPHAPSASAAITEANRSDFFICVLKGSDR